MKRFFCLVLLTCLFLSGCERAATRSNWSPINQAQTADSATSLPEQLSSPQPSATLPASKTTPQVIGTLDFSTLPSQFPESLKGYELYSWQVGEEWNYTLITGTNRSKAFDEIIAPGNSVSSDGFVKISTSGLDELKKVLKLLPKGQDIFWGGMDLGGEIPAGMVYLTFPPQSIIDEITAYCTSLHLNLTSLRPQ